MKTLTYIFAFLILSASFISCSGESDDLTETDPVEGLNLIHEFTADKYSVELYSELHGFETGYNEISVRIKDAATKKYVTNAVIDWMPLMHMETKEHSAPHTQLGIAEDSSVYTGSVIFQMPGNETEYWELKFTMNIDGKEIVSGQRVSVESPADGLKRLQVFTGNDGIKYVLAYVNPKTPKIGINDLQAMLFKMENMMSFPEINDYTIAIDPRMPGMGNHSSPNNEDLVYDMATGIYRGKLSLTMTGYWKINLKLINSNGELIKGEDITETNTESDLYFEVEF